jgi:hypothetical protein
MAIGSGSLRTRAASLLHPYVSVQHQPHGQQADLERSATVPPTQYAELSINEKQAGNGQAGDRKHSESLSTAGKTLTSSNDDAVAQNRRGQQLVRTIPRECAQFAWKLGIRGILVGFYCSHRTDLSIFQLGWNSWM